MLQVHVLSIHFPSSLPLFVKIVYKKFVLRLSASILFSVMLVKLVC